MIIQKTFVEWQHFPECLIRIIATNIYLVPGTVVIPSCIGLPNKISDT